MDIRSVLKNKISVSSLLVLLGLFTVTFVFLVQSPVNILLLNGNSLIDSSVFQTIGMQMKNGLMPYRDSFDHKGPLLYIYNYLGILIRPHRGIWVIEFISAFAAFGMMYKIARLKCDRPQAFLVLLFCVAALYPYFEGGNLSEEYALPFIAAAIYIFADYFMNGRISRLRLVVCGFGLGAVCLLRVNMIAVWIVFCCAVLLKCIFEKQLAEIPKFLLWFLIGFGIIVIPICGWLIINNAFADFIEDYFVFNMAYTQDARRASSLNKYNTFSAFANNIYILTAIVITCYVCKRRKLFHIAYLAYEVATLLLICISGQVYPHYGMILVPMLVYPFSFLLSKEVIKKKTYILAFALYFSIANVIPAWIGGINTMAQYLLMEDKTRERTDTVGHICNYILANSDKDDRIIVWGNWNYVYVLSERLPASKYSYQSPIGSVDETILSEFFSEITENQPRMVIISGWSSGTEELFNFFSEYEYVCTYEVDGATVYMQNFER